MRRTGWIVSVLFALALVGCPDSPDGQDFIPGGASCDVDIRPWDKKRLILVPVTTFDPKDANIHVFDVIPTSTESGSIHAIGIGNAAGGALKLTPPDSGEIDANWVFKPWRCKLTWTETFKVKVEIWSLTKADPIPVGSSGLSSVKIDRPGAWSPPRRGNSSKDYTELHCVIGGEGLTFSLISAKP